MAIFKYSATDLNGKRKEGTVDARSQDLAVSLLKNQGLFVINLAEQRNSLTDYILNFKGVSESEIVTFTRQFSTMVSAGLPLSRALDVLAEQTTSANFKKVIYEVLRDVEGGSPLSTALGRFPQHFSTTYQALVRAGESSGKLDEILKRLAVAMEADRELKGKFKSAMVYPIIVMIAMVGVLVIMMVFVIPKLAGMYESMNVELPMITKVMISVSSFVSKYILLLLAAGVGAFLFLKSFFGGPLGREVKSRISFALPVFGRINKLRDITQFTRTLSLLIGSAIPIVEALKIVAEVVQSTYYKAGALEAAKVVEKGSSLSDYFKHNKIFPPLVGQMVSVGEETGQLDEVLDKVSGYFNSEVDNSVEGLSAALEPVILVVLGAMVGLLIVSIITPIYKITSSI